MPTRSEGQIALRMADAKLKLADWIEKEPILREVALFSELHGMTTEEMAVLAVPHLCEVLKFYKEQPDTALKYQPPAPILVQTSATKEELLAQFDPKGKTDILKPKKEGD